MSYYKISTHFFPSLKRHLQSLNIEPSTFKFDELSDSQKGEVLSWFCERKNTDNVDVSLCKHYITNFQKSLVPQPSMDELEPLKPSSTKHEAPKMSKRQADVEQAMNYNGNKSI